MTCPATELLGARSEALGRPVWMTTGAVKRPERACPDRIGPARSRCSAQNNSSLENGPEPPTLALALIGLVAVGLLMIGRQAVEDGR